MEHWQYTLESLGSLGEAARAAPLSAWVMSGQAFLVLTLVFLVWRMGRWAAKVNTRLIASQEELTRRLTQAHEAVVARMSGTVDKVIVRLLAVEEEDEAD